MEQFCGSNAPHPQHNPFRLSRLSLSLLASLSHTMQQPTTVIVAAPPAPAQQGCSCAVGPNVSSHVKGVRFLKLLLCATVRSVWLVRVGEVQDAKPRYKSRGRDNICNTCGVGVGLTAVVHALVLGGRGKKDMYVGRCLSARSPVRP